MPILGSKSVLPTHTYTPQTAHQPGRSQHSQPADSNWLSQSVLQRKSRKGCARLCWLPKTGMAIPYKGRHILSSASCARHPEIRCPTNFALLGQLLSNPAHESHCLYHVYGMHYHTTEQTKLRALAKLCKICSC